jgi:hypothetical protein
MPDVPDALPAALAPFAQTLSEPVLAETARSALEWLSARCSAESRTDRRLPALVTVASVYARLCAPSRASERHFDVVARFTALFFLVDDAELGELPDLLATEASWSIGRHTPALRSWLSEFHEQEAAAPRLRERFARAYHDYLAARRAEHAHKTRPLDLAEHWAFRRRSIFMDPYLDLWLILLGVELDAVGGAPFTTARELAVDLVLLVNDLASLERDRQGGASPDDLNLVHTFASQHGVPEAEAHELLVAEHNRLIRRYRAASETAVAARPGPHAERYADLLSGVIDGNVAAVRALGFRYPGAGPMLPRLDAARA